MQAMLDFDDHHWWYRGRRKIIRSELDRLALPSDAKVLDAGCGSGRTLTELAPYGEVFGIELDPDAAEVARGRNAGEVQIGRLEELPWDADTFDLITCLDVIEHTADDRVTLSELRRVSRPGGVAAGHRPRVSGAVVAARRFQPPLPPLRTSHPARRGAGQRLARAPGDLVQQPAVWRRRRLFASPSGGDRAPTTSRT